jgi:transcriptional regulator with XRE-family HTH domain
MAEERVYRPNQIVAYNLRRLRTERGWSQMDAAGRLAPFLGVVWTSANFSVAERHWPKEGQKVREFGADEIVAFAAVFGVGIDALFQPPPDAGTVRPGGGTTGLPVDAYRGLLVPLQAERQELTELEGRARDLLAGMRDLGIDPSALLPDLPEPSVEEMRRKRQALDRLDQPVDDRSE